EARELPDSPEADLVRGFGFSNDVLTVDPTTGHATLETTLPSLQLAFLADGYPAEFLTSLFIAPSNLNGDLFLENRSQLYALDFTESADGQSVSLVPDSAGYSIYWLTHQSLDNEPILLKVGDVEGYSVDYGKQIDQIS